MNINNKANHFRLNFPNFSLKPQLRRSHDVRNVIYETENAIFKFHLPDVINRLTFYSTEHNVSEATELLRLISSSSDNPVRITEKNNYFQFICLYLVDQGKVNVICKICTHHYYVWCHFNYS